MSKGPYDFSGWATKCNLRCSDGRTIREGAFKDSDGKRVPLVWNHKHNDPDEVLGHADLEYRPGGNVYAYCKFNSNPKSAIAKELVHAGDVTSLSIWANQLKQDGGDVLHGIIREVSLVLAGANPGAFIDTVLEHGEIMEDEGIVYYEPHDGDLELYHADDEDEDEDREEADETGEGAEEEPKEEPKAPAPKKEAEDESDEDADGVDIVKILNTLNDQQKMAVGLLFEEVSKKGGEVKHSDDLAEDASVEEIIHAMSEQQKDALDELLGAVISEYSEGGNSDMKHNVFDSETNSRNVLSHEDMEQIFRDGKRLGSLKAAVEEHMEDGVLAHADDEVERPLYNKDASNNPYGIGNYDYIFPDARAINNIPEFIQRDMGWVKKVINGTHHTPFSRVKSIFADITPDEARAKGYVKGKKKVEEVFTLLKRTTDPQTIYKKQKLDRDDILDITDFDVVAWIKGEMRMMLEEEIARAILIGDGRLSSSDDKIQESHIRPVYNDDDLYTVKKAVEVSATATSSDIAEAAIDAAVRARKDYKGTGTPTFFTTEEVLTEMLLLKDGIGHKFYRTEAELATALRVKEIVTVEPMEGQEIAITIEGTTTKYPLLGVIVNLADYNVGADKGGQTNLFDDFDIDYNQYKYLLETRMSGALIRPYSAISLYTKKA